MLLVKDDFRGSIPASDHVNSHLISLRSVCLHAAKASRETKIADLKIAVHVDKDIRWLEVAMHDVGAVQVEHTPEELIHKVLIVLIRQLLPRVDELMHICFHQLGYYVDVLIAHLRGRFLNV